jgi:hypothetical protein
MEFKIGDKVIVKKFRAYIGDEPKEKPEDYHSKLFYGKIVTVVEKSYGNSSWEMEVTGESNNLCVMKDQIYPAYFTKTELYKTLDGESE